LSPFQAVLWAAFFNFSLLVLDLGGTVAKTSALMEIIWLYSPVLLLRFVGIC
jgi:hypothetical protein